MCELPSSSYLQQTTECGPKVGRSVRDRERGSSSLPTPTIEPSERGGLPAWDRGRSREVPRSDSQGWFRATNSLSSQRARFSGCRSVARAQALGACFRGFESHHPDHDMEDVVPAAGHRPRKPAGLKGPRFDSSFFRYAWKANLSREGARLLTGAVRKDWGSSPLLSAAGFPDLTVPFNGSGGKSLAHGGCSLMVRHWIVAPGTRVRFPSLTPDLLVVRSRRGPR